MLAPRDKSPAKPKKMTFGPWMLGAFRVLAKFKFLRGTPFDPSAIAPTGEPSGA